MSKRLGIALIAAVALAGAAYWAYWSSHRTLDDGIRVIDSHKAKLGELVSVVRANTHLYVSCSVSAQGAPRLVCPKAGSEHDAKDYARVRQLMNAIGVDRLEVLHSQDTGEAIRMTVEMFSNCSLISDARPVLGVWTVHAGHAYNKGCKPTSMRHWFVCPAKCISWP